MYRFHPTTKLLLSMKHPTMSNMTAAVVAASSIASSSDRSTGNNSNAVIASVAALSTSSSSSFSPPPTSNKIVKQSQTTKTTSIPPPRLYLGTMTFGWTSQTSSVVDTDVAYQMVQTFMEHYHQDGGDGDSVRNSDSDSGGYNIDTARIYANGDTEPMVGKVMERCMKVEKKNNHNKNVEVVPVNFLVGTKGHPSQLYGLSPHGIELQIAESLQCLKVPSISEYYLHQPDVNHSLLESLQTLNTLRSKNIITNHIGMSNYHVDEMKYAYEICQEHQLQYKPTMYQGLYNPLNRLVEDELIPYLHSQNCSFIAYNPLAGGLLVDGKHPLPVDTTTSTSTESYSPPKGRFGQNNPNYIPRFYTGPNFQAIQIIQKACTDVQISMVDATYRWFLFHSALSSSSSQKTNDEKKNDYYRDGILLGASSVQQLQQNMIACTKCYTKIIKDDDDEKKIIMYEYEPLPPSVLQAFDDAWEITKPTAFPYWRSYSLDMPNRDQLDHGASYEAKQTKKETK